MEIKRTVITVKWCVIFNAINMLYQQELYTVPTKNICYSLFTQHFVSGKYISSAHKQNPSKLSIYKHKGDS